MPLSNVANSKIIPVATRSRPYYNDFNEDKNFYGIPFRPGFAVQARELTQLQSILQNQIERFGLHIFQNGSLVLGGKLSIDSANHLNLQSTYANTDIVAADFVKTNIIRYGTANNIVRGRVVGAQEADTTAGTPPVLVLRYLSGDEFVENDVINVANNSSMIANVATANANGVATVVSVDDGVVFINGYFVKFPAQTIVLEPWSVYPTYKIGLEFDDSIVTEVDDTSLLDPAQEAFNYQAPGAARYKIDLTLAKRAIDSEDDEKFIEISRIANGVIQSIQEFGTYSEIGDTLARQKFDESGHFTVRPFKINLKDHPTDDTMFRAYISPGKAYVKGYEFETLIQTYVDLPRARDSLSVNNYDIAMNYGNYFIGKELRGPFRQDTMATADIHLVPYQRVNLVTANSYSSSKIGTLRIRNVIFESGSNLANANTHTHRISVFDTQFSNLTAQTNVATANSLTIYDPGNRLSGIDDAYKNATIRIITGTGADATVSYPIVAYNAATKNVITSGLWNTPLNGTSNVSIDFDFSDAESIMISAYTAGAPSERANVNIDNASKTGAATGGDAYLSETDFNALVVSFPQAFIKQGSINDQDYQYRKRFTTTFTAGSGSISVTPPDETFNASNGSSSGISTSYLENFLVIRDDNGSLLPMTSVAVNNGTGTATFTAAESYSGGVTVIASVNLNSGSNINPKRKTLTTGNTTHLVRSPSDTRILTKNSSQNTTVYLTQGQVTIENPNKVPGEAQSLYVSDVRAVTRIFDLGGAAIPAANTALAAYTDVTNKYNFNNGQKDSHYDHAFISVKPRVAVPRGPLVVVFDWYDHIQGDTADGLGYFSVDSYPSANTTAGYSGIPGYINDEGNTIQLRDAIDFRPRRQNASNTFPNYTLQGIRIPTPNENFEADYEYFIPRRDFIVLTGNRKAAVQSLQGVPALYPQNPRNAADNMVLYKLFIPPYTMSTENVSIEFVEHKRYTMRDIGVLETRIESLEYYQMLSLLEKATQDLTILDADGLERSKYGMLVDSFEGHGIGDVLNPDYRCAMDKIGGALTCSMNTVEHKLYTNSYTNTKKLGAVTTLDYTEVEAISQPLATKFLNVQPYAFAQFGGVFDVFPPFDIWIDTSVAPDVILNLNGVNDNLANIGQSSGGSSGGQGHTGTTSPQQPANNATTGTSSLPQTWFGTRSSFSWPPISHTGLGGAGWGGINNQPR